MSEKEEIRILARNKRARHIYEILDTLEGGLMLAGTEVKSAREGRIQLRDAHVDFRRGEAYLVNAHISPYSHGNRENHVPERPRKLLLQRRQIDRLFSQKQLKGLSIVPLSVYLKGSWIKVELAVVRGKKLHDKRQVEKERELEKEAREAVKLGRG
jgi:SsrA-binding protein